MSCKRAQGFLESTGAAVKETVDSNKHKIGPADALKLLDGVLVAKAMGEATKVGADSDAGWIAYARGRVLFVKYYPYFAEGHYSDGGNSVETYWDQQVAELEPLSPEITLAPQASYSLPEKWTLIPLKKDVTTFEQARALVSKIPPSPFKSAK